MKKKSSDFFKRIRIKYKLSVLNESTLEEVYHFRLSTLSLFALAMSVSLLSFILFSTLILNTPLKKLLPENTDNHVRNEVLRNSMKIDSLSQELQKKQEYIDVIRDIVAGNINIDSSYSADIVVAKKIQEKFIEKSKAEKDFCDEFESEEKYNLVNLTTNQNTDLLFFRPVKGIITQKFNSRNTDNFGINISVDQNTSVSAIYKGTVIFTGYDVNMGYFIQILHPQNFISVYKQASVILKKEGDTVTTGEVIAIVGDRKDRKPALHFELWQNGRAQNPEDYIGFD